MRARTTRVGTWTSKIIAEKQPNQRARRRRGRLKWLNWVWRGIRNSHYFWAIPSSQSILGDSIGVPAAATHLCHQGTVVPTKRRKKQYTPSSTTNNRPTSHLAKNRRDFNTSRDLAKKVTTSWTRTALRMHRSRASRTTPRRPKPARKVCSPSKATRYSSAKFK